MVEAECLLRKTEKTKKTFKDKSVAKGYNQKPGDYGESFSPVIKNTSMRLLFVIAAKYGI